MDTEYGALFKIDDVKQSDSGGWEVAGYASTYGNLDAGGDVVMRGAFDSSIEAEHKVRFLYAHRTDQVLGLPKSLKSDDRGLFGVFKISKTALGEDVHTLLKDGALDSFSIGYVPTDVEFDDSGARLLKGVDLLEVSVVALPMNGKATVTRVKAEWDASYVNNLPDSAFAVVLPGGKKDSEGKTVPRSLRKLPHHDSNGGVDLPHLRNALAREPQTNMPASAHASASAHLAKHAKAEGVGQDSRGLDLELDVPFEDLVAQVKGFLELGCDEAEALRARRLEDGRKLAASHLEAIDSLVAHAKASAERLERLLTVETQRPGDLLLRLSLARRLATRRGFFSEESA
ncbi:MAG TPA: HK97 family phage prohead protease [Methylomirabilota bacterium]|nr:HK97 family phage prohead protease [Methylomirabilota bacterium]